MDSKQNSCIEQFVQDESVRIQKSVESMVKDMYAYELGLLKTRISYLTNLIDLAQQTGKSKSLAGRCVTVGYSKPTSREISFIEKNYNLHVKEIEETADDPKQYTIHFSSYDEMEAIVESITDRLKNLRSMYVN